MEAFERRCAYCNEPINLTLEMEIDHVISEALADHPEELKEVLETHQLPPTFDLAGPLNLVAACKRCNSKKGGDRAAGFIVIGLKAAKHRAEVIDNLLQKYRAEPKIDDALAQVGTAVETGALTREYIAGFFEIDPKPISQTNVLLESDILRIFGNASTGLMSWPQTTAGIWLPRPEVDTVLGKFDRPDSFTALLGEPGCGKSAMLAHLGQGLADRGVALLALKADLLPPELSSLASLDEYLGTPATLTECIRQLAESETVVLLIDQLDAVSELMVQKTSRLTVLLSLVNRLRGIVNVHILLSCRTFEFKHDLRLTALNPEAVTLDDPPFHLVETILRTANIHCADWPAAAKELLRRPQHLNFFIQHLSHNGLPAVHSYHSMLESVLRVRVLGPVGDSGGRVLEGIAAMMADEENLWLPVSRFSGEDRRDLDRLVAADLLTYSSDHVRVGFRHQTIFDFVRARAFGSGVASLAQHVLDRQDSLFVRPILWRSLQYLREADRRAYRDQVRILWAEHGLRLHIRLLLVAFIGQVKDPDAFEVALIRPALVNLELRGQVVRTIQGNPAWFECIIPDLPAMMLGDDVAASNAAWLIRPALNFSISAALSLIERCWLPDRTKDGFVLHALGELKQWEERSFLIAETATRRSPNAGGWSRRLEDVIAKTRPDLAPRLVAAELWGSLERAEAQPVSIPEPPSHDAPDEERIAFRLRHGDASYAAVKEIVTDHSRWHGVSALAAMAPRSFVEQVWPWVLRVAKAYRDERVSRSVTYCEDHIFRDSYRYHEDLTSGLEAAVVGFADEQPEAFLQFARENLNFDLQTIHRWLAMGYRRLGRAHPTECIEYLLADSRRFTLGLSNNRHQQTCELIQACVPYADPHLLKALEQQISNWVLYPSYSDDDARLRFERAKWSREHRLRVLRSIPSNTLSPEAAKLLREEQRALPNVPERDWELTEFTAVRSPMEAKEMALASRDDLMRLFDELHDSTGWSHPRQPMKGGVVETSRAFGELAKAHPDLVLSRIDDLQPGRHERYASEAIQKLAESGACDPAGLVKVIHVLSVRGFDSEVFRHGAASSLSKIAEKQHGLDNDTCEMLESWLVDCTGTLGERESEVTEVGSSDNARSVLWNDRGGLLPWGNYPALGALFLGYLLREPSDITNWLHVLERHAQKREDPRVWIALASHQLQFLAQADRSRAATLLESILHRPDVLASEESARLVARLHGWLPPQLIHYCLNQWRFGNWRPGPQAAAEVAMLRHALVPSDLYCSDLVDSVVAGTIPDEQLTDLRLGLTYAAAEIWQVPKARSEATRVLIALLPCTNESMVHAWRRVFHSSWQIMDDCSRQVMQVVIQNREILRTPHVDSIVRRLKELVEKGLEPELVCEVVNALVDEGGDAIGNFQTAWASSAGDLTHIALTLQRLPGTVGCGLQIFERLMAINAYQIEKVLTDLDRKWPS